MKFSNLLNRGCHLSALILFLSSCSCSEKNDEFFYSEFTQLDSLEIALPLEYLQITNWTTYNSNEKKILVEYGLNSEGNLLIHQIDFDKKTYLNPIYINREGPDGFNSFGASVFFKSEDSIYVFPSSKDSFFLYNSKGIKSNEYKYNSLNNDRYYKNSYYSSTAIFDQLLMMTTVDDTRYDDPEFLKKVSPVQLYDLRSSSFIDRLNFPDFVKGKYMPSNISGATISQIDKDNILINYSFSDSIYIYNVKDKLMMSLYCGSTSFGSPRLLDYVPNRYQSLEYISKEVDYESAFFHREKIFRVVSHLLDSKYYSYGPLEIVQNEFRVVSLVEMNLDTKKLKYFKMPTAKYFVFQGNHLFVGGVSVREENGEIYRKFYKYSLD